MNKEERKVPELRFKGFHDDWEQRKLINIAIFYSGGTPSVTKKEYYDGNIPFIRSAEINRKETKLSLSNSGLKNSSAKMVSEGDILYALYGATSGEVGISKINGAINQAILAIKLNHLNSSFFIFNWLKKSKEKIIRKYLQGGQGNLSSSIIKNLNVKLPLDIEEQDKIGKLIKNIDDTIDLHRRKAIILNKIMKLYLVKLFTQDEKIFPELHFINFSAVWEQRTFKNLFEKIKSYPLSRSVETQDDTGVRYIHYGDIHTKVADKVNNRSNIPNIKDNKYEALMEGDIVLADASEDYQGIAEPAVIIEETNFKIVAGLHTIALRPRSVDSLFTYYLIKSPLFRKHGYKTGTGMKVFGITATNVLKFSTPLPEIEEQYKVGRFLNQINQTILFHEKKINSLTELKKIYLHKMFL